MDLILGKICIINRSARFLGPFIIGNLFAWIAKETWGRNGLIDSDGILLRTIFYVMTPILAVVILFWKNEDNLRIIKGGIIVFALSLANSCLLRIWNSSLTDAYWGLSMCLAILSALMLSKKTN